MNSPKAAPRTDVTDQNGAYLLVTQTGLKAYGCRE